MRKEMFSASGSWYKGNLHSHTTNSDGRLTPKEAVELYKSYGYSFLCFSEHDVYTDLRAELECEDFILLPGVEASAWLLHAEDAGAARQLLRKDLTLPELAKYLGRVKARLIKTHHIHGILGNQAMQEKAGEKLFQPGERFCPPVYLETWDGLQAAQQLSDSLRERGCFTTYNHPAWSRVEMEEVVGLQNIWAAEVYNYGTDVECGEGRDSIFWETMLRRGTHIHGFASDDNHNNGRFFDSLGGWVCVRSEELSHEAIVNHLMAGDYYFSAGPEIYQWGLDGEHVFVECSDVERIHFLVGGAVGSSETVLRHESPLRRGVHRLRGGETYVRVECVDSRGRTAWTNALWLPR